ncbi:hypothetical protein KKG22_00980 [Patescibacteria group bacterium]|nr:hypothetical protein [Patescibacteria group bacterium]MBU1722009.1 hypothetical protein [Patescibacteria group bacterium]MBU1901241.1 hypothetical protein [Patescibacteria group bacterium]
MNTTDKREELIHKTFVSMIKILFIFGIPALIGFFVGRYMDKTYDISPYGSLVTLACTFILSWLMTIRLYMSISQNFRVLKQEEDSQRNITQQMLKDNISSK